MVLDNEEAGGVCSPAFSSVAAKRITANAY
jgi:hypothetical protein